MTVRSRWLVFAITTPLVVLVAVGGLIGASPDAPLQRGFAHLRVFQDVISLITQAYVEEVQIDPVMDGAMRGLADSLDAESAYLTPAEVKAADGGDSLGPADIGVTIARQFYLRVVGVRDGSPAARAGLRTGDFIRAIDGTPTRDMSAYRGTRRLAGQAGSTVELLVIRTSAADPHTITLTREAPSDRLVTARRLDGAAVARVHRFTPGTAGALATEIGNLRLTGATPLIIDLRNVAGGTADDAIAAARLFVKYGPLATRTERDGVPHPTAPEATDGGLTMPVVLLVSNGTAHAAEIFAAALQGNDRATLVGEPTPGLAGEQQLFRLPDGHGLWMTYAQYLKPDGTPIHGAGLDPDVPMGMPVVDFGEAPPATDAMLDRALEVARSGKTGAGER
ncbi:MAG TPA: S41 family peptidase [Vicinamibacterales bacterium]|nr:S41 family peptidase [Vicinamibacterales bacterium]